MSQRLVAFIAPWFGWGVLQLIGKTSRICVHRHPRYQELLASGKPCIYAFWHRYQLLMVYEHRHRGVTVLVSRSKDGELIARTLNLFGFQTVRGSSSRGGAAALGQLIDLVSGGARVAFTPDGPRGPLRSVQQGVVAAAQKTGAPIVPVAWAGNGARELSSWDRFLIPFPFSRFEVVYGEPVGLSAEQTDGESVVQGALDAAVDEAKRLLSDRRSGVHGK